MISIVVPAYNEEKRVGSSLIIINDYFKKSGNEYEIIVVDDGSIDRTRQVVEGLIENIRNLQLIRCEKNMGKGFALRTGVFASSGEEVLVTDADLSTPIDEYDKLRPFLIKDRFDLVIGSRGLDLSNIIIKQPWWRECMGKIFNKIVKSLVIDDFSDTQCGFKLFSSVAAKSLFSKAKIDRFAYDVEILALAKMEGFGIKEVPIRWIDSPESRVSPATDAFRMLLDLIRIRRSIGAVKKNFY